MVRNKKTLEFAAMADAELLRLKNVNRTFAMGEVEVEVLKHVTFDVLDGELLAIVGPSGSGKSTILNLIGGLDQPSSGQIMFDGLDLALATSVQLTEYRRRHVGFVFQFYNLISNLTARENVMAATEICDSPLDIDETLEMVGLTDRRDHFPSQMSGGEQQRVAIARAIAKNPRLLLCDEPTGALDFQTTKPILRLLIDLNQKLGATIVLITHNMALARVAGRVIQLRSGSIGEVYENSTILPPEEIEW